jgi:hypothetical protein
MEVVDCCEGVPGVADDHLSLRAAPDGQLVLVAKDGIGNGRLHLYIRSLAGAWGPRTLVNPDPTSQPTRPTLVLDVENSHAYVVHHNSTDKVMYLSRTSLSSPGFGAACAFLSQGNNVTSTRQPVNGTTDLVAAASSGGTIFPGLIDLAAGP